MKKSKAFTSFRLTSYSLFLTRSSLNYASTPSNSTNHHQISPLSSTNDPLAFAAALSVSSTKNSPILGTQIHGKSFKLGFSNDIFSQNNLLGMYSKCGHLWDALKVFEEMPERNLVSWTSMISAFVHNGEYWMSLKLYLEMLRAGFCPNEFGLAAVLTACAAMNNAEFGRSIHSVALKIGLDCNPFVGSSLLHTYAKCRCIGFAEFVFEFIEHKDLACWNAMVEGYAINGYGCDAIRTVSLMHCNRLIADQFTYISALKGCTITGNLNYAQQIHGTIVSSGLEFNTSVMNALTDTYCRNGMKDTAFKVFRRTKGKDIVSWNTVISSLAQEEDLREVVALFCKLLLSGLRPNEVTLSIIFRLCGSMEDLSLGLQFFCFTYRLGLFNDMLVVSSLVSMFSKYGLVENAYHMFWSAPARIIVTWNEMLTGYVSNDHFKEALQLFRRAIRSDVELDEYTYSTIFSACQGPEDLKLGEEIHARIIKLGFCSSCAVSSAMSHAYSRFGSVESSFKIFQDSEVLDMVSWGTIISAFSKHGFTNETISLINCLRGRDENLDEFILSSALNACANVAAFNHCRCIHAHVQKTGYESHVVVASAAVDAYSKCGDISSSKLAFDSSSREDDAVLFNAMITAYAHHGLIAEAVELFEKMEHVNVSPSHTTFVAVISACNHLGLVEEGQLFFNSISTDYGMSPSKDNFACLVDLLARNGLLEKARHVIECMPFEPWPAIWRSLLNGSRIHGDKVMATLAAERIFQLMPGDVDAHVLLSNVCAEDGRWEDANKVKMKMEEEGLNKIPGLSKIEI
ncbi:TPR-like protein [Dioscorea alata]|uniref:TPR-like protein n=1 Tax=Dioscorea alata TaxID=55571 RepID=A0ACB7U165_DIOAL|nr:TPR-like protein [Dioscorea alata]